jgi:hypothetical protein
MQGPRPQRLAQHHVLGLQVGVDNAANAVDVVQPQQYLQVDEVLPLTRCVSTSHEAHVHSFAAPLPCRTPCRAPAFL